jgi:hypothetical protein
MRESKHRSTKHTEEIKNATKCNSENLKGEDDIEYIREY